MLAGKNFVPIDNHVLLRQREKETISKGGIHIPEIAQRQQQWGEIMAVGPNVLNKEGIVIGAEALEKSSRVGTRFRSGDEWYLLVRETEIVAVRPKE